jgi:hypothetical protein
MQKRLGRPEKPTAPPEPPEDVKLLTEIRDLLKANLQNGQPATEQPAVTPKP